MGLVGRIKFYVASQPFLAVNLSDILKIYRCTLYRLRDSLYNETFRFRILSHDVENSITW